MKKLLFTIIGIFLFIPNLYSWTEYDRSGDFTGSVTVDTVTVRVRRIIDDEYSASNSVRYSSGTIYQLIDTAHKMFCIQSQVLTTWAYTSLVANTTEYALPDNCMFIERVTIDLWNNSGPNYIPQKTVFDLDLESRSWDISTSSPTAYYIRNRYIGFYPAPKYSSGLVTIWYIKKPANLSSGTDILFDNMPMVDPYVEAIASYVAYHLFLMDGDTARATIYAQTWGEMLTLFNATKGEHPDYNPSTSGTAYPKK